jgi:hypothetical protein
LQTKYLQRYYDYRVYLILFGKSTLAFLLILLPPIIFEKYTFYLYLTFSPNFFAYSGRRLWFDIIWFVASGAATALIVGRKKWVSLLVPFVASAAFIISVYSPPLCNPAECYISSTDGLGALRDFLFFASLGFLACSGVLSRKLSFRRHPQRETRIQTLYVFFISTLIGYALSFFPIVHIFAGVTVPFPLNYIQWFLASTIPSFTASFLAVERSKSGNLRTGKMFGFFSGLSGIILGIVLDFSVPCEACSNYFGFIASLLVTSAVFSFLGMILGDKIGIALVGTKKSYPGITVGITIIGTIVLLLFFFFSTNYEMSIVNSVSPRISNTSFSLLEVGSTFVYSGGYLSSSQVRVPAIGISVNFGDSSISSENSPNFLAAGIGDQSPNCCKDGLDLAYRADAVIFTNGTEALLARTWWACDVNMACDGYSWQQLLHFGEFALPKGTLSNWVDVRMNWTSPSEIGWYYRVHSSTNGNVTPWILYSSFEPPKIQNHYFDGGTIYVGSGNQPNDDAFFLQFGVSSAKEIKNNTWNVMMRCPEILENGTWSCIDHASFIGGRYGYWKVLYTFGESYSGLGFQFLGNYTVRFFYSGSSPKDETVIW